MVTFALIAEGKTDIAVIESILYSVYTDNYRINPVMPLMDATDTYRNAPEYFSNWQLVLTYLATNQIRLALAANDYLIVHIDTDLGEHPNFGLEISKFGITNDILTIVNSCKQILLSKLDAELTDSERDRIIFAIPVLTTECWLIGLYDLKHQHKPNTINNCEARLHIAVNRSIKIVKTYDGYLKLSRNFMKSKITRQVSARVECLNLFLSALPPSKVI